MPYQQIRRLRWTAFLLVVLCYMLAFFHRMAPAAIAGELQHDFQASGAALGALAAMYFYIYTVMQIPVGVMADTLGVRRIVTAGALVSGIGSLMFATAESLPMAYAGRLLVGLGVSVFFISLMKLNAVWFHDRHFGAAGGLTILLGNMGAVLAASPLVWLVGQTSWRNVFVAVGVLSLLLAVLVWWQVRNQPGDVGLPSLRELEGKPPHPRHKGHWWDGLVRVAKNRATWPGFFPNFGIAGTLFAFAGLWAVPYLCGAHGLSREVASQHNSLLLLGFAIGALCCGMLSDRIGRRKPIIVGGALLYVLCWLPILGLWQLPLTWSYAQFFVMGFVASGFTLAWAAAKEVNPPALSGMATSVVNTGSFIGAGILQPLVGWVMDREWAGQVSGGVRLYSPENFQSGLSVMFAFALVGLIGACFIRETHCRYPAD
ncbi:MAG: MFS transporter [Nitrosomonadales bacterium]|nr:MFS transporter [Nitrosomonadales bacterium]